MTAEFTQLLLILGGIAVGVGLLVAIFVFVGNPRGSKKYRPGRPFEFTPVWFLAAPQGQARAGLVGGTPGKELTAASATRRVVRPMETGGASDRW